MQKFEPHFIAAFLAINQFFQKHKIRYCLIGGIAAGFWGVPRFTQDMDFTVATKNFSEKKLLSELKKEGFIARAKGSSQIQVLKKGDLSFQADLILSEIDYQEWVIQRAIPVEVFGCTVPICSPEDLVVLKLIANRRQDLLDIENILRNPSIAWDKAYLKAWTEHWKVVDRFSAEFGGEFPNFLS